LYGGRPIFVGAQAQQQPDGPESFRLGMKLFSDQQYEDAANALWRSVLLHGQTPPSQTYDVTQAFQTFMQCYIAQDRMADGLAFVSLESFRRGQTDMGKNYLQQALSVDPNNEAALRVQRDFGQGQSPTTTQQSSSNTANSASSTMNQADPLRGKSPEELYAIASDAFAKKEFEKCADIFERSCRQSQSELGPACANAIYCRTMIADWGFNGTQFDADMKEISRLTEKEMLTYKVIFSEDKPPGWKRATSVHPHMMLGYPVDPMLKREVTESVAFLDELMARADKRGPDGQIPPLPPDLPYAIDHKKYLKQVSERPNFKLRVGFVGSGFNSKAVLYLSQDIFRFYDRNRFEVHIFSFGENQEL
jgi:protein O-GlcNAc transferase